MSLWDFFFRKPGNRSADVGADPQYEAATAEIERLAEPCLRFERASPGSSVRSRLGGVPPISGRFDWPSWDDRPLAFVGLVELSEIQAALELDWLPSEGRLLFFTDPEQEAWGFDPKHRDGWAVLFDPEPNPALTIDPPESLPEHGRFDALSIVASAATSFPSLEKIQESVGCLSSEVWDLLDEQFYAESFGHQMGGYPVPVQGDHMELECQLASNGIYVGDSDGYRSVEAKALEAGKDDWKLLLQVDSEDDADMMGVTAAACISGYASKMPKIGIFRRVG